MPQINFVLIFVFGLAMVMFTLRTPPPPPCASCLG